MATRSGGRRKSGGGSTQLIQKPAKFHPKSLGDAAGLEQLSGHKRKASTKMESASKRNRNVQEADWEDDDDDYDYDDDDVKKPSRRRKKTEVERVLGPLIQAIADVLDKFGIFKGSSELEERKAALEELCQTFSKRVHLTDFIDDKKSKDTLGSTLWLPFVLPNDGKSHQLEDRQMVREQLVYQFQALEKLRRSRMLELKKFPPSFYCKTPNWQRCQKDPEMTIRAGRYKPQASYPLPLELLHESF